MAHAYKVAAQSNPSATTLTDAYTVPASTKVVGWVNVCNRGGATTFRLSHAVAGAADDNKQYLAYDTAINANDIITIKFAAAATDVIRVYAGAATLSFNVYVDEMT